ncbi:DUF1294 domain-containing protein [Ornithinibacillus halotolerans]|uniref:DUF1294 domain-containing protein n=1 Tax=Ornithinibacillus halotolerans TaxID=1274357 RepID=A0A916S683_9BACI|nr:DUF1294 domain-containing protein [Ornithinibacillus halotolerans]GGA86489.1 hypothetical protein GCM10008025_31730 [Ornithinibacillus halotolerans]
MELIFYIGFANLLGFVLMGVDKKKARNNEWRIPERTLWGVALLGGAIGAFLGMRVFRHKTKHTSFRIGLPLIIVVHIVLFSYFYMS